jgi:hypothetical protein
MIYAHVYGPTSLARKLSLGPVMNQQSIRLYEAKRSQTNRGQ